MKIRNFRVVWLFLYFFSSAVFAETITIVTLSPTGVATQDVRTKAVGESINVVVKPKVGFKGVVKVDGVVVATGEVNRVLRYKYRVAGNSTVETSYLQNISGNLALNQAVLGALSGAEINAYLLSDLHTPIEVAIQADNSLTDLTKAGTFRLTLEGIADNQWVLVTATGGKDIDANDDGQLDLQPTVNQGTIHALATAADWRKGGLTLNILSEMSWQYTRSLIGQVPESDLAIRMDQLATLWVKQDINTDGLIDWMDLLEFTPSDAQQQAKLNFNYQDLFAIKADGLSIISAVHQNNSASLARLLDIQFSENLMQNPIVDDRYSKIALKAMIFGQGQIQGEVGTGINVNSVTGEHTQTVYVLKDATNTLTLTATPTTKTRIINWEGCDYVSVDLTQCQITMDKAHDVIASFAYKIVELNGIVHDLSQATNSLTANQVDVTIDAGLTELISQLAQAQVGDFIVGSTGSGFLRKITAINAIDSQHYQLTTSEASLEEVIKQGTAILQKTLVNSDLQGYTAAASPQAKARVARAAFQGLDGIELLPSKKPDDKTFTLRFGERQRQAKKKASVKNSLEAEVKGGTITATSEISADSVKNSLEAEVKGGTITATSEISADSVKNSLEGTVILFDNHKGGTITATGEISLEIGIDADVDIGWTGLSSFKYLTTINTTESLQFNLDASASFEKEKRIGTLNFNRIKFMIGFLPVWITPKVELFIGMNGDIVTKAKTGVEFRQKLTAGVLYADDKFSGITRFSHDWTATYPQATAEANTKGWIKAVPSFLIYDGVGPKIPLESFLKLNASMSLKSEQCQESVFTASLSAGVLADFEWNLQGRTKIGRFLHLNDLEQAASFNIYKKNWEIKKWALKTSPCVEPSYMKVEGSGIQTTLSESELSTPLTSAVRLTHEGTEQVSWKVEYLKDDGIVTVTPDTGLLSLTASSIKIKVDTSLLPLGNYRNGIRFVNTSSKGVSAGKAGDKTLPINIEVQADVLTAPVLKSVTSTQQGTAQLQWSFDPSAASVPLSKYYIFSSISPDNPNSWKLQDIVTSIEDKSITLNGLDAGVVYFSIEAHGNDRETPASNILSVKIIGGGESELSNVVTTEPTCTVESNCNIPRIEVINSNRTGNNLSVKIKVTGKNVREFGVFWYGKDIRLFTLFQPNSSTGGFAEKEFYSDGTESSTYSFSYIYERNTFISDDEYNKLIGQKITPLVVFYNRYGTESDYKDITVSTPLTSFFLAQ